MKSTIESVYISSMYKGPRVRSFLIKRRRVGVRGATRGSGACLESSKPRLEKSISNTSELDGSTAHRERANLDIPGTERLRETNQALLSLSLSFF